MYLNIPDAGRIFYQRCGSGPPILMLHPVGLDMSFWDAIIPEMSREYTVYVLDFRGHGRSDPASEPFTLDDLVADVREFCRMLNIKQAVLCGLSMGGMVAQKIALEDPDLISALILADTTAKTDPAMMVARAELVETGGMLAVLEQTLERWFTPETLRDRPELVNGVRRQLLSDDPKMHGWAWRAIAGMDVIDRISEIRTPCLILCGDQDPSTTPQIAKELNKRIPGSVYVEIANASHMSVLEQPGAFAEAIRVFLDKLSVNGSK